MQDHCFLTLGTFLEVIIGKLLHELRLLKVIGAKFDGLTRWLPHLRQLFILVIIQSKLSHVLTLALMLKLIL